MDQTRKDRSGKANHEARFEPAQQGGRHSFESLKKLILNPIRANSPDHPSFENAMNRMARYLIEYSDRLSEQDLKELSGLEDMDKDVVYYLEDDPLYDVGHDFVHADYSKIRELAKRELSRRVGA
jgi:hypothetical protein